LLFFIVVVVVVVVVVLFIFFVGFFPPYSPLLGIHFAFVLPFFFFMIFRFLLRRLHRRVIPETFRAVCFEFVGRFPPAVSVDIIYIYK